ncbi:MAG: DUF1272 domain-containing protein [Oceanococcus sp.]
MMLALVSNCCGRCYRQMKGNRQKNWRINTAITKLPCCAHSQNPVDCGNTQACSELKQGQVHMLEMKKKCEKCHSDLSEDSPIYICSYECTFCDSCTQSMHHDCPNCGGQLVLRPIRGKTTVRRLNS